MSPPITEILKERNGDEEPEKGKIRAGKAVGKPPDEGSSTTATNTLDNSKFEAANQKAGDGTTKTFRDLGVVEELCDACVKLGWKTPTPIQREAIPLALSGRDIVGLAETGSGKTGAFALPMLQALLDTAPFSRGLFGLVLAPTRELATQIGQAYEALGASIGLRCAVIIGGLDMVPQAIALGKKPHVVIATPGRLLDHLEKTKGFSLGKLKWLIMDEADRMLDLDFAAVIEKMLHFIPRERQTALFSATMSNKVEALQRASLRDPVRVSISSNKYQTVPTLVQHYMFIPFMHKDTYFIWLLNEHKGRSCVVFCRTILETQRLAFLVRSLGFDAIPLHGNLSQSARLGAYNRFKSAACDILVCTDVAARGLDIAKVDVVINYNLPMDSKTYVHRVGRTARAGKSGVAISLVTQYDLEIYLRIEHALGNKLPEILYEKDEIMVFRPRVEEAQRQAKQEMRALMNVKGGKWVVKGKTGKKRKGEKGRRGRDDDMDREEE